MSIPDGNCKCGKEHKVHRKGKSIGVWSGLLIAILPKCPFCVMAYSSAVTLCSGATMYDHTPTWISWISIGLAAFTLIITLWNYKGTRTLLAGLLILFGSSFILNSELRTGDVNAYYWGTFFLLSGVWLNGSFLHFLRKGRNKVLSVLRVKKGRSY